MLLSPPPCPPPIAQVCEKGGGLSGGLSTPRPHRVGTLELRFQSSVAGESGAVRGAVRGLLRSPNVTISRKWLNCGSWGATQSMFQRVGGGGRRRRSSNWGPSGGRVGGDAVGVSRGCLRSPDPEGSNWVPPHPFRVPAQSMGAPPPCHRGYPPPMI